MIALIGELQYRLSHVKKTSWHWRIAEDFLGEDAQGKACTYYCLKLPFTLFAWTIRLMVLAVFLPINWFFGRRPRIHHPKEGYQPPETTWWYVYPYKTSRKGTKYLLAPWEIALALFVVGGVVGQLFFGLNFFGTLAKFGQAIGFPIGVGLGLFLLWLLVMGLWYCFRYGLPSLWRLFWRGFMWPFKLLGQKCPPLVVED